jgi:hypothetical protein
MAQTIQQDNLPIIDDITVKDVVADACVGISMFSGSVRITFAAISVDYTVAAAPSRRVVSARLVMPIRAIAELRDALTQVMDKFTTKRIATPDPNFPTIIIPPELSI